MASAVPVAGEGLSVGRVFSRAASVITDNPLTVFGIALVFGALPSALINWLETGLRGSLTDEYSRLGYSAITLGSAIVSMILSALVQGALVRATLAHAESKRASFAESASTGLAAALPLVGLAVLMGIAVGIGFVLFVVPGVMLYLMWAVASPALVAERTGVFGAFGRSRELTKGARWKVLGVELVVVLAWWIISAVIGGMLLAMLGFKGMQQIGQHGWPVTWAIGTIIISTLVNALWSTVQTALYVELRAWKGGHSNEVLQDIFA
jgi:hypothetical protein